MADATVAALTIFGAGFLLGLSFRYLVAMALGRPLVFKRIK